VNADDVQAQFKQLRSSLKARWDRFTDDDVKELKGKTEDLVNKVQERYGILKDDAERQVADWIGKVKSDLGLAAKPARKRSVSRKAPAKKAARSKGAAKGKAKAKKAAGKGATRRSARKPAKKSARSKRR
jgi:uncharacterized protein YjbJ (UPF0337 family)